jgi:hypothetical protein
MPASFNPYLRAMHLPQKPLAALLVTLLAILAAGCQGETEFTFADEANSICEGQYADFANSLALTGLVKSIEEDVRARREREEATAEATSKLSELDPPESEAADFRAYLAARYDQQDLSARARQALATGDTSAYRAADLALIEADRRLRRFEQRLGFDVCAQDLSETAEQAVRDQLEEIFLEEDLNCPFNFSTRYLREGLGVSEDEEVECLPLQDDLLPDDIEITAVRGSEREIASAEVRLRGGPADGRVIGVRMLYRRYTPVVADVLWISRPPLPAGS